MTLVTTANCRQFLAEAAKHKPEIINSIWQDCTTAMQDD